jgi:hypothetical protein
MECGFACKGLDFGMRRGLYNSATIMAHLKTPALRAVRIHRVLAKGSSRGPVHRYRGNGDPKLFRPTEVIRLTGIYEVIHDRGHRESHEVVMHAGDVFPACDTCDLRVRFRLVRTAPYIFDDEDFEKEK